MPDPAAGDAFADVLDANRRYRDFVHTSALEGRALKELAVVTCMDSRIDPLAMLGLHRGDAKIVRNAGGRVTGDALRSLVLATNLLGVNRIAVIQHTGCAMAGSTEDAMRDRVATAAGQSADGWTFLTTDDQRASIRDDIARIEACPLIADDVAVGGFIFDVDTGALRPLEA
jgi:carbonic anhydrase